MKIENIKFKAKRRDNGEWVEGDLMKESYGARIVEHTSKADNWLAVDPSTVCQYTGLTDCEGNEVWEGDLLQSQITESIYEIVWHKFLGFIMKNPRSGGHLSETLGCLLQLGKFKVIGNKFDNDK